MKAVKKKTQKGVKAKKPIKGGSSPSDYDKVKKSPAKAPMKKKK